MCLSTREVKSKMDLQCFGYGIMPSDMIRMLVTVKGLSTCIIARHPVRITSPKGSCQACFGHTEGTNIISSNSAAVPYTFCGGRWLPSLEVFLFSSEAGPARLDQMPAASLQLMVL